MSRLKVVTERGEFKILLQADSAPETCHYFLNLAKTGTFDGAHVFRIVNTSNDLSKRPVNINVLQIGSVRGLDENRDFIRHESTQITGLSHLKWSVSAARYEPGCVYKSFFICMNDEPELDCGGNRHEDKQGFAVFGRICDGFDIVEDIFACAETDEILAHPIIVKNITSN